MPIFGRYLLKHFLSVLLLSLTSFIAILLVSRLEEIAHFAAMGAPLSYIGRFTLYQIPYILPIAIPICCLISAMILFQRLSHTHELTALRAGGFSLKLIAGPILLTAAFFSILNFYVVSELATASHLKSRKMAYELTSSNPLLLLQSAKVAKLKGAYVQMDPIRNGRAAKDLLLAMKNPTTKRVTLCSAPKIWMDAGEIKAEGVGLISTVSGSDQDHLVIENQASMTSKASEFAYLMRNKGWRVANDHLTLSLLRTRKEALQKEGRHKLAECHSEITRRLSLGLAAFTFTLMGIAFGIEQSRSRSKRGIVIVLSLTSLTLITFFVGKGFSHLYLTASALFLLPHLLIILSSTWALHRVSRGMG